MIEINSETMFDLPLLYREAKEVDPEKASKIGTSYIDLTIDFKEACEQFREVIEQSGRTGK